MSREATGQGTSFLFLDNQGAEDRAIQAAEQELAKRLQEDVDPVPCPDCGLYQREMFSVICSGLYWWMIVLAVVGFVGSFICLLLLSWLFWNTRGAAATTAAVGGVFGGALIGLGSLKWRKLRCAAYDPNSQHRADARRANRERTMLREEFERDGIERLMAPLVQEHVKGELSEARHDLVLRLLLSLFFVVIGVGFLIWMRQEIVNGLASNS
ncbi:MAG: hypothetical protein KF708_06570, partial [Pirellulales bacterium]|nr:hypothetical protein [Pirellulales bacterium]